MHTLLPGPGVDDGHRGQDRSPHLPEIGDASAFKSSAHLAANAGIAPVTRSSGTSIKGALISMARRCDPLYAMLRNPALYRQPVPDTTPTAA